MPKLRCWLFGHERMTTLGAHGVCLRCGQRGEVPDLSRVSAPAEGPGTDDGGRLAGMHVQVHATGRAR
jgi:hypothetical protein